MTKALVPLTDGVEEMEAVILIDVLRRAGWAVTAAGMAPGAIVASRGVRIDPDCLWEEIDPADFDILVIPGCAGARTLAGDRRVLDAARAFAAAGKWVAAICAAPLVLHAAGLLEGVRFTSHPSVAEELPGTRSSERVVVDGRIVTSQGPGSAFEFALELIRRLAGPDAAAKVAGPMMLPAG